MNIVVYCSAQDNLADKYLQLATALGQWIGRNGHTLYYGGANQGLMHVIAQSCHDAGGHVIGVLPKVFSHRIDSACDEVIHTDNLGDRKQIMIDCGDVFVVLPGGIGTLDEWISTLTVMCIGDDDHRPIIVIDPDGMFDATVQQLADLTRTPFGRGKDLTRTLITRSVTDLLHILDGLSS